MIEWLLRHVPGFNRLRVEVKAHLPVLAAVRRQLEETVSDIEGAVVDVCRNFQGMADSAKNTVARNRELLEDGTGAVDRGQFQDLLKASRTTIEHLLERMQANGEITMRVVSRMEQVERVTRQVVKQLAEIDKIAFTNKLLALNAAIQAVHVGEAGRAFGVVADEISEQASRSSQITESIGGNVRDLSTCIVAATNELRELSAKDRTMLCASRAEVDSALTAFEQVHRSLMAMLEESRDTSAQLTNEISRSITTLQFQDRVSQRIGHVVQALESMESRLGGAAACQISAAAGDRHEQVLTDLHNRYTMKSERDAVPSAVAIAAESDENADVELF